MLFVIPARAGSKRFPRKNHVLVPRTIETVQKAGWVPYVFTDDVELEDHAVDLGAIAVTRQPADDRQSMRECLEQFSEAMGLVPEERLVVCYPTFYLRTAADLRAVAELVAERDPFTSLLSLRPLRTPVHLIYRTDVCRPAFSDERQTYRCQDEAGEFAELTHFLCAVRVGALPDLNPQLRDAGTLFADADPLRSMVDVDTREDLALAEALEKTSARIPRGSHP